MTDLRTLGKAMRDAQRAYFKDRSRENLIASKQLEATFDKALADPALEAAEREFGALVVKAETAIREWQDREAAAEARAVEAERQLAAVREALRTLIEAAEKVRHWHDAMADSSGMVVSAESVRGLWDATDTARATLSDAPAPKGQSDD